MTLLFKIWTLILPGHHTFHSHVYSGGADDAGRWGARCWAASSRHPMQMADARGAWRDVSEQVLRKSFGIQTTCPGERHAPLDPV